MTKPNGPIAARLVAEAFVVHHNAPCDDGLRRDLWAACLAVDSPINVKCTGDAYKWTKGDRQFRRRFYFRSDALDYAEIERQKCIRENRMPETMEQRQKREDKEDAEADAKAGQVLKRLK